MATHIPSCLLQPYAIYWYLTVLCRRCVVCKGNAVEDEGNRIFHILKIRLLKNTTLKFNFARQLAEMAESKSFYLSFAFKSKIHLRIHVCARWVYIRILLEGNRNLGNVRLLLYVLLVSKGFFSYVKVHHNPYNSF